MENKRCELMIHEAGCLIMVAPMSLGGREYSDLFEVFDDQEQLRRMIQDGALMPMDLYQDDGYVVRVVLGELNEQEATEWTARVRWKLNIPCGQLLVTGALDNEEGFEEMRDGDKSWLGGYVEVPAGEYGVEVYSYPPGDLTSGWGQIENFDGSGLFKPSREIEPEKPMDYFARTRNGEAPPAWIREDGFVREGEYINFVVRLAPLTGDLSTPEFEEGGFLKWEFRKPERCPFGVRSLTFPPLPAES
jgi:hypothetical protein